MLTLVTLLDLDTHVLWIMAGITLWILSPSRRLHLLGEAARVHLEPQRVPS